MSVVNRFNVNNTPVKLDADIIENMSANDVSYESSFQYDENTVGSKLSELESKTVQQGIYDVSANNNGAVFESLQSLLSSSNLSTLIPTAVRKGGMSIRFIQGTEPNSDNKYVQYRLMANTFTTDITQWQGVDDEPTTGSDNLVKSGGIARELNKLSNSIWRLEYSFTANNGVTYIIAAVDDNGYVGFGLRLDGKLKFFEEEVDFANKLSNSTLIQQIVSNIASQSSLIEALSEKIVGMFVEEYYNFAVIDKEGYIGLKLDKYGKLIYSPSDKTIDLYESIIRRIIGEVVSPELSEPMIWTPNNCYILEGTTVQIFKGSIAPVHNPENYELRIECPSDMTSNDNFGVNYDFCYEYAVNTSNPDFELKFGLYSDLSNKVYLDSHKVKFVHVSKKSSPVSVKNILCIGDSFTNAEYWPAELNRLLTNQSTLYSDNREGAPTSDNLSNLNFIGTRDTGSNRTPNEGISGWNYQKFVTDPTSPFLFNGSVDFDKYLTERDVHGSITDNIQQIDIVIIALNTNGGYDDTVCNAMYDALLAHNHQMKILICGRAFATPYGLPTSLYHNQTYVKLSRSLKQSEEFLQNKCAEDNYKNNLLYVDYHLQLDSFHNMPHMPIYPNLRNKTDYDKIMRGNNNVHPSDIGYYQMADALRAAFHYWCL